MLFFDVTEITNENAITDLSESNSEFEILKEEIETIYEDIVLCENTFFFNEADSSTLKEKIHNIIDKIITWIKNMAKKIKFVAIEQRIKMLKTDEFEIEERVANIDLWLSYANDLLNHVAKDGQIPEKVLARYSIFTSKEAKTKKVNKSTLLRVVKSIQKSFTITSKLEKMENLMKQKVESGSTDLSVQVSNLTKVVTIYKNVIGASITAVNKALKGGLTSKENIEKVEGQVVDKDGKPVNQHLLTYGESVILESEKEWSNIRESLTRVKYEALLTEDMELYNEGLSDIKEKIKDFFSNLIKRVKELVEKFVTKFNEFKKKYSQKLGKVTSKMGLTVEVQIYDWNTSAFGKFIPMLNKFLDETLKNATNKNAEAIYSQSKETNAYGRMLKLNKNISQTEFNDFIIQTFNKTNEKQEKHLTLGQLIRINDDLFYSSLNFGGDLRTVGKNLISKLEKFANAFEEAGQHTKDQLTMVRAAYLKQSALAAVNAFNVGLMIADRANRDLMTLNSTYRKKVGLGDFSSNMSF